MREIIANHEMAVEGENIDPLDAFMASLDSEIVQQAVLSRSSLEQASTRSSGDIDHDTSSGAHVLSPSGAQGAAANKVAASPYCDISRERGGRTDGSGQDEHPDAREACLELLLLQPASFLRRFGHLLSVEDLDSLPPSEDPAVAVHIARLQALKVQQHQGAHVSSRETHRCLDVEMVPVTASSRRDDHHDGGQPEHAIPLGVSSPLFSDQYQGSRAPCQPGSARIRNRRYRRLRQLAEGGVWFSDDAMKERDPWLWYEYVGRKSGEERPTPKNATEQVPGSTSVGTYLQESLGFLSQRQMGDWATDSHASPERADPSLGMAFLTGCWSPDKCCEGAVTSADEGPDGGVSDVSRDRTNDVSDVDASVPRRRQEEKTLQIEASMDTPANEDGRSCDEAVTAAVAELGIGDDRARGKSNASVGGCVRRVRFQEGTRGGEQVDCHLEAESDDAMQDVKYAMDGEEEDEPAVGGRQEVARVLSERFLAGEEDGVDYGAVDGDERLDDLDQMARDEVCWTGSIVAACPLNVSY